MNRRKALALALLSSGVLPAHLIAQDLDDPRDRPADPARKRKPVATKPTPKRTARAADDPEGEPEGSSPAEAADLKNEPGHEWRQWNISRYTALAADSSNPNPEAKIIEWIFRRTNSSVWHGEKLAVLHASRTKLVAYHNPKVLKQVDSIVKRFIDSVADILSIRVRFVRAADTRWRYLVHSRLNSLGSGPQGQQVWSLNPTDAATVLNQIQVYRGYEPIEDKRFKLVNGQNFELEKYEPVDYVVGTQRDGAAGLGFQQAVAQLKEGISLRISPLLTHDGDALDLAVDLQTNVVRRLIKTSILTRREIGPGDFQITVPEASETRLNQPVTNWPIKDALIISAGVTPGILESKNGFLRVPGTLPTDRELLVVIEVEAANEAPRTARRGEDREDR